MELRDYLESKEGFRISTGERKRAKIKAGMSDPMPMGSAKIIHQTRGRIRLGIPRLKTDTAYANHLQSLLTSMDKVSDIRLSPSTASVIINYSPDIPDVEFATLAMKTIGVASIS